MFSQWNNLCLPESSQTSAKTGFSYRGQWILSVKSDSKHTVGFMDQTSVLCKCTILILPPKAVIGQSIQQTAQCCNTTLFIKNKQLVFTTTFSNPCPVAQSFKWSSWYVAGRGFLRIESSQETRTEKDLMTRHCYVAWNLGSRRTWNYSVPGHLFHMSQ